MGYFYGKKGVTLYAECISLTDIEHGNGSVVENSDGTVSVYIPSGPVFLRKDCCERLNPSKNYYFDVNTQKCRWTTKTDKCSLDNIKVTLNPDGNDGTIFYTDSVDEVCSLTIDFDYLFKVSCESLTNILNDTDKTPEQLYAEKVVRDIQIQITEKSAECETISKQIIELNKQITATSYSIVCAQSVAARPTIGTIQPKLNNFGNTGFNPIAPFGFDLEDYITVTLCLTDTGLNTWANILGSTNYNNFLNGDPNSYTCNEFNNIKEQNDVIIKNNTINNTQVPELVFECTTPFGFKSQLFKNLDVLNEKQALCQSKLEELTTKLTSAQANLEIVEPISCVNPIDTFETLDISVSLDVIDASGKTTTIATYPLLSPIGVGNLYTYLVDNGDNSGFLVCGESSATELAKGITGCTPMYINDTKNVFSCSSVYDNLTNELFIESTLTDKTAFLETLNNDVFASKWIHHNTIIDDQTIISDIINKKIKLSVTINHSCSDFCVLMDNIQLNKSCQLITEKNMFIAQPPSFELERLIDNKKSWVSNTSFVNRTFRINNQSNVNPIRLTDYDVNDERLVINTKEIDLDISIASGIETDVWCYIVDNPCLLTAVTESTICCSGCCSGESSINFTELMTQPLSAVTTIEDFEYYITSELIDAKSRKVLSGYPTLRALYDRYSNSNEYCPTTSSAFDYEKMDQFAHLIDSYWVDIVEQVVPATTIWGSVKIYGNTMFDQQKFQYKKSSLFTCTNNDCGDLDSVNACLFNLVEDFYLRTSDDCHNNLCYKKGFSRLDFLDDLDQMPTTDQIRSFGSAICGCNYSSLDSVIASHENAITTVYDQDALFGNNLNTFTQQMVEYTNNLQNGFCDGDVDMVTPDISLVSNDAFPNNFRHIGKPVKVKTDCSAIASVMEGWTANTDPTYFMTLEQIYSAYTNDFKYIRAVDVVGNLPISGSAGDLIWVGTPISRVGYAWDPIANSWSTTMYDFIDSEILTDRRAENNAFVKAKREMMYAMRPFTWANYHLLLHPIKLWALQEEPIITGNEIINSETNITPCSYEQTAEPCVTLPFCGPNRRTITPQC